LKTNERMDEKDMEKEPNGKRKGWGIEIKMFFLGIAGLVSVTRTIFFNIETVKFLISKFSTSC
jgi:hypothetical protein